jgi:hypothetical protein
MGAVYNPIRVRDLHQLFAALLVDEPPPALPTETQRAMLRAIRPEAGGGTGRDAGDAITEET